MSRRPAPLLLAFVASLAVIVYAAGVVASGAGAVPTTANGSLPPDDAIDHSEQAGAPHAPRHEGAGVVNRHREGRTVFAAAPFSTPPLAVLPTTELPARDQAARRHVFEPERVQGSVAGASHRTSRGPPLLVA